MLLGTWKFTFSVFLISQPWESSSCPFFNLQQQQQQQQDGQNATSIFFEPFPHPQKDSNGGGLRGNLEERKLQRGGCNSEFRYGKFDLGLRPLDVDYKTLLRLSNIAEDYMEDHPQICARGRDGQTRDGSPCLSGRFLNMDSPAGYTFLGQLVSHDMNNAKTAVLGESVEPEEICNANTPDLDLDTIYNFLGRPAAMRRKRGLFKLRGRDYARTREGQAKIPDNRNDEHVILSQLTVAFMRLHNLYVSDFVRNNNRGDFDPTEAFEFGRMNTIRVYQSIAANELLPNLCDSDMLELVRNPSNRLLYVGDVRESKAMAIEFSDAAWRVIHSRTRSRYDLNGNMRDVNFFNLGDDSLTLLGGSPLSRSMEIQWGLFFGNGAQDGRILDMCYSQPLNRMPTSGALLPAEKNNILCERRNERGCPIDPSDNADGFQGATVSLSMLDLVRGKDHGLCGGIAMAQAVRRLEDQNNIGRPGERVQVLSMAQMRSEAVFGLPDFYNEDDVPLLLYLFYESIIQNDGQVCGKLCTRIIAEVILGNIEDAPFSIFADDFNGRLERFGRDVTIMDVMREINFA